ncbi:MAG: ABC transporter permease [Legionellaceae bacterium]|nr:ABC transporter permease [Legionellaceae bacterium]
MKSVWSYRGFILASVSREFRLKYQNSLLGVFWTIIHPISMIFIYTVVFSKIMHGRLPGVNNTLSYSIYLCSGIITWLFFAEIINRCINVFLDNATIIKKLSFPRLCLPFIVVLGSVSNFLIVLGLFTLFLWISGNFPGWVYLALPIILAVQIAFAMGFGLLLGILNVFFRDVGQFFMVVLQFWFWMTPIVYSVSILPDQIQSILKFNPMYPIMNAYHDVFVSHCWPNWSSLMFPITMAVLCCTLALRTFRKRSDEMVDEL